MASPIDSSGLSGMLAEVLSALGRLQAQPGSPEEQESPTGTGWGADGGIGAAHDEVSSYAFECYQDALDEIAAAGIDVVEIEFNPGPLSLTAFLTAHRAELAA
jgi:hypothetical protein